MSVSRVAQHKLISVYLLLSMGCFGLYTLVLSLTSIIGLHSGLNPLDVGILTAVLTGLGIFTDWPLAHVARLYGDRFIVLCGSVCLIVSCSLLYLTTVGEDNTLSIIILIVSTVISAVGFSCMIAPLLGGIATQAKGAQYRVQALNAIVQRIGAFGASLFIGYLFYSNNIWVGAMAALLVSVIMVVLTTSLPIRKKQTEARPVGSERRSGLGGVSNAIKKSIYISACVQAYLIAAYSFFPAVMGANGLDGTVGSALAFREVVAIAAAVLAGTIFAGYSLSRFWVLIAFLGAVSLAAVPYVFDPLTVIVLFSVHGAALGIGIMLGNVHVYFGTTTETRSYGFAIVVMSTRVTGIVTPIILGGALELSVDAFSAAIFIYLMVLTVLYAVVKISPEIVQPE